MANSCGRPFQLPMRDDTVTKFVLFALIVCTFQRTSYTDRVPVEAPQTVYIMEYPVVIELKLCVKSMLPVPRFAPAPVELAALLMICEFPAQSVIVTDVPKGMEEI